MCGAISDNSLPAQAANSTKEQFANSPDLHHEFTGAVIDALDAHTEMSTQALNSDVVRRGLLDILLNYAGLYEALRGNHPQSGDRP